MHQRSSTKTLIFVVVVIVIAAAVYFYFSGQEKKSDSGLQASAPIDNKTGRGAKVLSLLNQVNSLRIDGALFKIPAYATLQDFSVKVPEQAIGRNNPFSPVSGSAGTSTKTSSP